MKNHIQEAENLPEASRGRRAFLQLSALGAIGTLPLWNAATSQAAQAKNTAPTVAASPMPIVDAELEPKKSRSPKEKPTTRRNVICHTSR